MSILAPRRPRPSLLRTALTFMVIGGAGVSVAFVRPATTGEGEFLESESNLEETATSAARKGMECLSSSSDSIRSFSIRGDGNAVPNWKWTDGGFTIVRPVAGMRLCMRAEGDVSLNTEGTAVLALGGADSWLVVESRSEKTHRLAVTQGPGGIEREWSVDGIRLPLDAEARQWRNLMFTVMRGYQEAWLPYSGAMVLYGRISGYRNELSKVMSAMRAGQQARARRILESDLAPWEAGLRGVTEAIQQSGLDDELGAIARRLADYDLAAVRLETEFEASELDDWLREIAEQVQGEIRGRSLELRLEEAERSMQEVIAELEEVTR